MKRIGRRRGVEGNKIQNKITRSLRGIWWLGSEDR
jgi:hypothetical protein